MLFVVTHTHSAERCPAHEGKEAVKKYYQRLSPNAAKRADVRIVGAYTAPSEHTQFLILEADSYLSVTKFLGGLQTIGTTDITPVSTVEERLKLL